MSETRRICNENFYTASETKCRQWIEQLSAKSTASDAPSPVSGIVPHAGWFYSGSIAGLVWKTLSERCQPKTIVVFGTVHYPGVRGNAAYPAGSWETPIGPLEVDAELSRGLAEELEALLLLDPRAHDQEHSIEVNLPFVKALFPHAKILPIAVPPSSEAARLGARIGELTADQSVIAVGSTDLTHYGPRYMFAPKGSGPGAHDWMRENDQRIIDLIEGLDADRIVPEVESHHNACGPGATAATVAFAAARGVERGVLLDYATSFDVRPDPVFEMAVGYAGVVF